VCFGIVLDRLADAEQGPESRHITLVHQHLLSVLTGNLVGLLSPKVAAHAFSPHQFSGSGYVYAGFGALVCFKFGHLLNLLRFALLVYQILVRLFQAVPVFGRAGQWESESWTVPFLPTLALFPV
jgi:hypothetical protein